MGGFDKLCDGMNVILPGSGTVLKGAVKGREEYQAKKAQNYKEYLAGLAKIAIEQKAKHGKEPVLGVIAGSIPRAENPVGYIELSQPAIQKYVVGMPTKFDAKTGAVLYTKRVSVAELKDRYEDMLRYLIATDLYADYLSKTKAADAGIGPPEKSDIKSLAIPAAAIGALAWFLK